MIGTQAVITGHLRAFAHQHNYNNINNDNDNSNGITIKMEIIVFVTIIKWSTLKWWLQDNNITAAGGRGYASSNCSVKFIDTVEVILSDWRDTGAWNSKNQEKKLLWVCNKASDETYTKEAILES